MKRSGLGRGLDVLLPQSDLIETVVREIPMDEIETNEDQPRKQFDEEALSALADSIRSAGVLSPLIVVEHGTGYRIVAGERRYRASRMAGLQTVPCIVREMSSAQQMEAALIENIQREDLNPIEEATAVHSLIESCGYTQETAAQKLGKSRSAVANLLRLLTLPDYMQEYLQNGTITAGHARVLAGVDNEKRRDKLLSDCIAQSWNVRRLEEEAKKAPQSIGKKAKQQLSAEMIGFCDQMREAFGMKVALSGNEQKGKITLSYRNAKELEHLYHMVQQLTDRE